MKITAIIPLKICILILFIIIGVPSSAASANLPAQRTTWQLQLLGTVDQTVDAQLFVIDLYDNSEAVIASLKRTGKTVICYFSAGSYEDWRRDAKFFPAAVIGKSNGWAGEKWLDIRQIKLLSPIMTARMDIGKAKGCDGVDPDNLDGYTNTTGFTLTAADQLAYNIFIATEAHKRGLLVGLKNSVAQIAALEPYFDFAVNEQCFQYNECETYQPFLKAGKAVFNVEYDLALSEFCTEAKTLGMMSMKKPLDLRAPRNICWTNNETTPNSTVVLIADPQSTAPKLDSVVNTPPTKTKVVARNTVNVRSTPGGTRIGIQRAGAVGFRSSDLAIKARGRTWIHVDFINDADGYVAEEFLSSPTPLHALTTTVQTQISLLQQQIIFLQKKLSEGKQTK